MSQKIRIKLKSFDHNLVDKSAEKIVKTVKATGAVVSGPIPLPTHKRIFTVNRSTFVNKKSREQFELSTYKRLMDIEINDRAKTIDALMKTMEEYANGGFRQMAEMVDDNPNVLFKEGAFLDLFLPFITGEKQEGEELESLD